METVYSWREWFERPEYSLLYSHRNEKEARQIVELIYASGLLPDNSLVLDAGCGYGRLSYWFVKKGFRVVGVDISQRMIVEARKRVPDATFLQHDLRFPYWDSLFDCATSIFSSFGYWEDDLHNIFMLTSLSRALRRSGLFVLDYLNPTFVKKNLIPEETISKNDKTFHIKRWVHKNMVYKEIAWQENGNLLSFREQLKLLELDDLTRMLKVAGFTPVQVYGDYYGNAFNSLSSERTIIFSIKV